MPFNTVAQEIIKNSIKNVICIDDKFIEPYETGEDTEVLSEHELGESLFTNFSNNNCNVNICRYKNNIDSITSKSSHSDLVILDWELKETDPKYEDSLTILEKLIDTNISFICIYTKEQLSDVAEKLMTFFSGISQAEFSGFEENGKEFLTDEYSDILKDKEGFESSVKEYIFNQGSSRELNRIFMTHLREAHEIKGKDLNEALETIKSEVKISDCDKIFKLISLSLRGSHILSEQPNLKIHCIDNEKYIFSINGKLLLIRNKKVTGGEFAMNGEDLYKEISENMWRTPSSFLPLLFLEFQLHQRNTFKNTGTFLKEIDEAVLFYHKKTHKLDDEKMSRFLIEIFSEEVKFNLNKFSPELLKHLEHYAVDKGINDKIDTLEKTKKLKSEVEKLNHYMTFNHEKNLNLKEIRFGDVFKDDTDEYYLCITAHCDCSDPSKIDNHLVFVHADTSDFTSISKLGTLDAEYLTFIKEEKTFKTIRWVNGDGKIKIKTFFIENVDKNNLIAHYKNEERKLSYIGNQKENFTQRTANYAYSWMGRVGVSYSNYDGK